MRMNPCQDVPTLHHAVREHCPANEPAMHWLSGNQHAPAVPHSGRQTGYLAMLYAKLQGPILFISYYMSAVPQSRHLASKCSWLGNRVNINGWADLKTRKNQAGATQHMSSKILRAVCLLMPLCMLDTLKQSANMHSLMPQYTMKKINIQTAQVNHTLLWCLAWWVQQQYPAWFGYVGLWNEG